MTNYEIFDLLYCDFKDKFDEDNVVFTQKYVIGHQQILLYRLKGKEKFDAFACLEFLNNLQEKYGFSSTKLSPFYFNYFNANDSICEYQFVSENEDEKRMYEHFRSHAIS